MLTLESPAPQDETLPTGWTRTTLGEVAEYMNGRAFSKDDWGNAGRPIIRIQNLTGSSETLNRYSGDADERNIVRDGDLLISWAATLGAYVYHGEEAVLNQHIFKVMPYIDKTFLFYLVEASLRQLMGKVHGTGMQHITKGKFDSLAVQIPPLPEQRRIVAKLEELFTRLDAGVQAVRRSQTFLGRYRKAALKAAVDGDLTEVWRAARVADDGRTLGAQQSPISWTKANLGALTTKITSGSRDWSKYYGRGTGTFLMAQNVRPGRLDLTFRQAVDPPIGDRDRARSQVEPGDILVTIVGANTGNVCRVPGELPEHYVCQSVALLRPRDTSSSPYLAIYLNSEGHGQRQFRNYIYGAGRPHLSFDQLKATTVLLPPLEEQAAIVAEVERRLSIIDALEVTLAANLKRAERLRQSILQRAFSGRLVPQDPTDEPASELLHRIRLEKAARYAAGTGRRRGRPRKDADQEAML